jgi:hypothetical protein
MTMVKALAQKTEGRRGSQRRLEEGGRYLGIPPERGFLTRREREDDPHRVSLGVQEIGCGTLDTSFMMGCLITGDPAPSDVERYFRALRRAQRDIDVEPELYTHHFLKELPERYHALVDARAFGPGERIVFEPYTRDVFERTHKWMEDWNVFPPEQAGSAGYQDSVLTAG